MEVLALIPARGGSKSIPRKNIRLLYGQPLMAYSIVAGLQATSVSRVIVSTDDEEIASVARQFGAETPFTRPYEYSQDQTPDLPVFQHALRWLQENEGYSPDMVVQLRPTSPFRRVWHIDQAIQQLALRPDADSIRTVCIPFQNPFKMWRIGDEGIMHPLVNMEEVRHDSPLSELLNASFYKMGIDAPVHSQPGTSAIGAELYNLPRQVLPAVYWQTGYVDVAWTGTLLQKKSMTGDRILPLVMDPSEWIDIDSPDDWRRAERLLESGELTFDDLGFSFFN